jgi:murein DD-endopeptidase MepM/ murein hydrolase activator NlpD
MANLPPIDEDIRKVGVGGHRFEHPEAPSLFLREPSSSPDLSLAGVDRLLRQAKLEKQSYVEIEAALQRSGERLAGTPTIWPTSGHISRGYGTCTDPFTGLRRKHEGLDIVNRVGTPVVATAAGKVSKAGWQGGYGWMVVIDHGFGYQTAYGHLNSIGIKSGARVERGQKIGTLGNSGRSTGPHLHYEVRVNGQPVNPTKYILPDVVVD